MPFVTDIVGPQRPVRTWPPLVAGAVTANVRVLPWQKCPGAIGSAARVRGMTLAELRGRIRGEFVGTSTCTHLNDTLRAIGDLDALHDLRWGLKAR